MSFVVVVPVPTPSVEQESTGAVSPQSALADRVGGTGLRLGVLYNSKPNARELLTAVAALLEKGGHVAAIGSAVRTDGLFLPSEEQFEAMVADVDLVLVGLGDCSSCSACSVRVATDFEQRGVPAVAICTEPFSNAAKAMARRQGFEDYGIVTVEHPAASLGREALQARAEQALPQVVGLLDLGTPAAVGT
jgi:hypothetical protein